MKTLQRIINGGIWAALGLSAAVMMGQENNLNQQVEQLQKQLKQTQESFEKVLREHQQTIESLQRQLNTLQQQAGMHTTSALVPTQATPSAQPATETAAAGTNRWSPANPIRLQKGRSFLDVGLVATVAAGASTAHDIEGGTQLGGHDPNQNGFTLQGVEAVFAGAVDPYFRGYATLLFGLDAGGESFFELEEAYAETLSLPGKFQLRAGQYFTEFGRHNPTHPHTWAMVDTPLVLGRFLGPDGLRNPGARLSWLAPTPFYSELMLSVQNGQGETAHSFRNDHEGEAYLGRLHQTDRTKRLRDLLFTPRYVMSFDLTKNQTLMLGGSGAFGANASDPDAATRIFGADLFWKWKSARHQGGFPFVSFQTEGLLRQYQAGAFDWDLDGDGLVGGDERDLDGDGAPDFLPRERLTDYGFYSQLSYGFTRGWVAGLRGDYVAARTGQYERLFGADLDRASRWRLSPNLTWYPSEYSKIRLQYNFDDRKYLGTDHSIWLQLEFSLGAHAAHKF